MAAVKDPNGLYGTITKFEGFRSTPYPDPGNGNPFGLAIGFGNSRNPATGDWVRPGDTLDRASADALFGQAV